MPPEHSELHRWFTEHLWPHEERLQAWLRAQFPATADVDDLVHEAYLRVLGARSAGRAIASPKAFLFATARNLALMQLRRRRLERGEHATGNGPGELSDGTDVAGEVARAQEVQLLKEGIQQLPSRCRQILTLRKIYGLSQREIAGRLGIAERTVEAQVAIGLRKLAEYFEQVDRARVRRRHE